MTEEHWILKQPVTKERVQSLLTAVEAVGEGGSWTTGVVVWLAQGLLVALDQRDALGERLMREIGASEDN